MRMVVVAAAVATMLAGAIPASAEVVVRVGMPWFTGTWTVAITTAGTSIAPIAAS